VEQDRTEMGKPDPAAGSGHRRGAAAHPRGRRAELLIAEPETVELTGGIGAVLRYA
jgi:hypothetical protein